MTYADLSPHQLLSIVKAMGWKLVPGRGVTLHPSPSAPDARKALPKGLVIAINEKRTAIRVLLCLEEYQQARGKTFAAQLENS